MKAFLSTIFFLICTQNLLAERQIARQSTFLKNGINTPAFIQLGVLYNEKMRTSMLDVRFGVQTGYSDYATFHIGFVRTGFYDSTDHNNRYNINYWGPTAGITSQFNLPYKLGYSYLYGRGKARRHETVDASFVTAAVDQFQQIKLNEHRIFASYELTRNLHFEISNAWQHYKIADGDIQAKAYSISLRASLF